MVTWLNGQARLLLQPHMLKQSMAVLQGTTVIPLLTSVLLDKTQWETPDEFNPNHFLGVDGNFIKKKAFLPFSTGNESVWSCTGPHVRSATQKRLAKWQDWSFCWDQHGHWWWGWFRNTFPRFWWLANSPSAHAGRHAGGLQKIQHLQMSSTFPLPWEGWFLGCPRSIPCGHRVKQPFSNAYRRSAVMAAEYHAMLFCISEAYAVLHTIK